MRVLQFLVVVLAIRENFAWFRRVVNGRKVAPAQFKGVAAIMRPNGNFVFPVCGGAVIANNVIITAAHCVYYCDSSELDLKQIYVHAGSNNLRAGQLRSVANITCAGNNNDVALIKLTKPFGPKVTPLTYSFENEISNPCQVSSHAKTTSVNH